MPATKARGAVNRVAPLSNRERVIRLVNALFDHRALKESPIGPLLMLQKGAITRKLGEMTEANAAETIRSIKAIIG